MEIKENSLRKSTFDMCLNLNVLLQKDGLGSVVICYPKSRTSALIQSSSNLKRDKGLLVYVSLDQNSSVLQHLDPFLSIYLELRKMTHCL